jgi:hypothetical protein
MQKEKSISGLLFIELILQNAQIYESRILIDAAFL